MRYLAKRATFVRVKRTSLKLLFGREATMCDHSLLASTPSNAGFPVARTLPQARPGVREPAAADRPLRPDRQSGRLLGLVAHAGDDA
jgi:hypothetical protein